jgi:hypothetical protein
VTLPRYRASIGAGVGMVSLALMSTELVLTRIFSVIVWYHFAFFAISVALFGTGAAAVLVQLAQRRISPEGTGRVLVASTLGLGVTVGVVDVVLVHVTPNWFAAGSLFTTLTGRLLLMFLLAATPFFVGGVAISLALARYARVAHRVYFWDLGGAALACVLVVPLLGVLGGPGALLFAGALAFGATVAFAWGLDSPRRFAWAASGALLSLVAAAGAYAGPRSGWLEVQVAKGIDLRETPPAFHRWNAFSTVTVLPDEGFRGWGMSPVYTGPVPEQQKLVIDMNAMTTLTRFDGDLGSVQHALHDLSALLWTLRPGAERVCIIGAGGGKDVLAALASGARHVVAVEINPLIVDDVMRGAIPPRPAPPSRAPRAAAWPPVCPTSPRRPNGSRRTSATPGSSAHRAMTRPTARRPEPAR